MQRDNKDFNDTNRTPADRERERREARAMHETKDALSQLLMWLVPLALIALLGYYLFQRYSAPSITTEAVKTETAVEPTEVTAPAVETEAQQEAKVPTEVTPEPTEIEPIEGK